MLYILLDISFYLGYWIIKNLGYGFYCSIYYLLYGNNLKDNELENKKTLELLIKQEKDINEIKEFINKIKKE
jgi:hypothetical protein